MLTPTRADLLGIGDVIFPSWTIRDIERVGSKRRITVEAFDHQTEEFLIQPSMIVIREVELGS